jgi:hypothetical protein
VTIQASRGNGLFRLRPLLFGSAQHLPVWALFPFLQAVICFRAAHDRGRQFVNALIC